MLATACWEHVTSAGGPGVALVLYDLTTLYFEAEKEDGLRKVGMSKERRVDPQITVGLLVARDGFPLDIHVFEGNKAETKTLIPVITAFQQRHDIADMVVVADAGMLSAANLNALEDAGLSFIVASRTSKAPKELEDHFGRRGNAVPDGEVVELTRPMGQGRDRRDRRVVWHYKWQRAQRDYRTLNAQIDRAQRVADRSEPLKKQRFVKVTGQTVALDEASIERARQAAGYKGYVTNIDPTVMEGHAVVAAYHDLWQVEQSFRMAQVRSEGAADLPPNPRLDRGALDHRFRSSGDCPLHAEADRDVDQEDSANPATDPHRRDRRRRTRAHRPHPARRRRASHSHRHLTGALRRSNSGQIAADFGIHPMTLQKWIRKADVEAGIKPGTTAAKSQELREAKRRVRLLEQENEVLRRAAAYLSQANLPGKGGTRS